MTDSMVDTNVLIRACSQVTGNTPQDVRVMIESSSHLLERLDTIRVSAVTWLEFLRALRPEEQPRLVSFRRKVRVEVMDGAIAERAADMIKQRNLVEKPCQRCLNNQSVKPCGKCGALVSAQQKLNDSIIVATAEMLDDIRVLYSFDGPIRSFIPYLRHSRIESPPPPPASQQPSLPNVAV